MQHGGETIAKEIFGMFLILSRARAPGQSFAQPAPSARRGQKDDFDFL